MKNKNQIIDGFCQLLTGRADVFSRLAHQTCTDFSEETIHDFRVSTRRLLVAETLLGSEAKTRKWKKLSKKLLKQLSRLRDLQVLQIRYHEEIKLAECLSQDIEREVELLHELNQGISLDILGKEIYRSIKLRCKELAAHPDRLSKDTCGLWQKMRVEVDRLVMGADQHDYRLLHKLRIQFKSLRYLIEILLDAGIIKGIEIHEFKMWQDFLGNIQDLTVAIGWLERQQNTATIRQHLQQEMEQQRVDFWDKKDALFQLLDHLDQCIVDSELSCSCKTGS